MWLICNIFESVNPSIFKYKFVFVCYQRMHSRAVTGTQRMFNSIQFASTAITFIMSGRRCANAKLRDVSFSKLFVAFCKYVCRKQPVNFRMSFPSNYTYRPFSFRFSLGFIVFYFVVDVTTDPLFCYYFFLLSRKFEEIIVIFVFINPSCCLLNFESFYRATFVVIQHVYTIQSSLL